MTVPFSFEADSGVQALPGALEIGIARKTLPNLYRIRYTINPNKPGNKKRSPQAKRDGELIP
jgi:hypothetical protein